MNVLTFKTIQTKTKNNFLQTTCSHGKKLHIKNLCKKYLNDSKAILISNDENLYHSIEEPDEETLKKKELCQNFIRGNLIHYLDVILNSMEIYIIDSCFTGIILPLFKTNRLKAKRVRIIMRNLVDKYKL